jgi:hypothetical protein
MIKGSLEMLSAAHIYLGASLICSSDKSLYYRIIYPSFAKAVDRIIIDQAKAKPTHFSFRPLVVHPIIRGVSYSEFIPV